MNRYFNITGSCNPQEHYMVNLDSRLAQIKKMVDAGKLTREGNAFKLPLGA